jgi:mono/diheme cytochrome c family protein
MADGNGVANLQPPMRGSAVVAGDPDYLIRVVLEGATKVLPVNRPRYSNTMPPMNVLTDEQIATVLTFVREQFGNKASAINAGAVAKVRTQVEGKGQITRAPP